MLDWKLGFWDQSSNSNTLTTFSIMSNNYFLCVRVFSRILVLLGVGCQLVMQLMIWIQITSWHVSCLWLFRKSFSPQVPPTPTHPPLEFQMDWGKIVSLRNPDIPPLNAKTSNEKQHIEQVKCVYIAFVYLQTNCCHYISVVLKKKLKWNKKIKI